MGRSQVARQGFVIHRETMVLTGDADAATVQVFHRVVGAMVAKFHLESSGAAGQGQDLMAQADAKGRQAGFEQSAHSFDGIAAGLGVARPIAQE